METEAFDKLISARVCIPQGDKMAYGTVARRKRDADGNLIGTSHKNPIEDTSQYYEIQFDTGEVETYTANQIAKHVYALADTEGYSAFVMKDIIDHKKDDTPSRTNVWGHLHYQEWSNQKQEDNQRLEILYSMEWWEVWMGQAEGFEGVTSCGSSWICKG